MYIASALHELQTPAEHESELVISEVDDALEGWLRTLDPADIVFLLDSLAVSIGLLFSRKLALPAGCIIPPSASGMMTSLWDLL